MTRSR